MTWPAASVPSWPCARISRVEARLSASRSMVAISSTVGKAENSSGVWMNSDVIRISTEKVIEIASAKSSNSGGSGRMQHHQDGHHADRERDVAAPEHRADVGEARQRRTARRARRRSIGHAACSAPSVTVTCSKLCAAAGGPPAWKSGAALASKATPESRWKRAVELGLPGKMCRVYGYRGVNVMRDRCDDGRHNPRRTFVFLRGIFLGFCRAGADRGGYGPCACGHGGGSRRRHRAGPVEDHQPYRDRRHGRAAARIRRECLTRRRRSATSAATFSPDPAATINSVCAPIEHSLDGPQLTWHLVCKGQLDMEVSGDFNFDSPHHYTGTMRKARRFRHADGRLRKIRSKAQWVSACPQQ